MDANVRLAARHHLRETHRVNGQPSGTPGHDRPHAQARGSMPISILYARVRSDSGHRANRLTQSILCEQGRARKMLARRFTLTLFRESWAFKLKHRASRSSIADVDNMRTDTTVPATKNDCYVVNMLSDSLGCKS